MSSETNTFELKKNVLITGSTGMVGGLVLKKCLESDEVSKVITINRDKQSIDDPKLTEIVHDDFLDYSSIEKYFETIDVVYYCIGVYTGAVGREEFRKITVDYTKAFANVVIKQSPGATFCLLSGAGADRTEKSRMMFATDKGAAENFLMQSKLSNVLMFRPGYIYPVTPRKEPNFSYVISRKLYPIMKAIVPNAVITSEELAQVIFREGLKRKGMVTYENKDMKKIINNYQKNI